MQPTCSSLKFWCILCMQKNQNNAAYKPSQSIASDCYDDLF